MNKSSFSILTKDVIWLIMAKLDPEDILKLCESGIVSSRYCEDEELYKYLLNIHYNGYGNFIDDKTYKDKYLHLIKVVTPEMCLQVKNKKYSAEDVIGIWLFNLDNLFDVLYRETGNDHDFGVLNIYDQESYMGEYHDLQGILSEYLNIYRCNERSFIDKVKSSDPKTLKALEEYFDIDFRGGNFHYPNVETITFEEYIQNLQTFEDRLQDYIIKNTNENIIDKIQSHINPNDIIDDDKVDQLTKYYYDREEKIFLQILHINIRNKKLHIFDKFDHDEIIPKLIGY